MPLQLQIARVSRRLFWQTFLDTLAWCWTGALALAIVWFFAQPWVLNEPRVWLRWAVAGGLLGSASVLALVLAVLRAPSRLAAALSLDERFGLRERVTTSLTLAPEQVHTSAAQALLADVNQRIGQLDIGSRFPVGMSRSAAFVPAAALLLACVAFFYDPSQGQATLTGNDDGKKPPPNAAAIEQKMKELVKKREEKRPADKPKSEELQQLETKLEEIANRPRSTKDQLRERMQEMTALEEQMKKREREMSEKMQALKQQLKQLDRLGDREADREGPAKDLQKALKEGDLEKAKNEVERLAKKLEENELNDREKQQLLKQIQKLQEQMQNLAEQKDKEEELKKLAREGKLDAETLKRELENIKKDEQKMKELQDLAKKLGECKDCLQKGDSKSAAQKLQQAGNKLAKMDLDEEDLKDLREQLQKLQSAKDTAAGGQQKSSRPGAKRPEAPESPFKSFESRNKVDFDAKGKKIFDGYAPGDNFKKRTTAEISGEIQQASQEAPEAIEQQRIPKAARDMAKDYFRNLGGQADKNQKK
jgi:uncharacterized coiled-coil DUF342 family protein